MVDHEDRLVLPRLLNQRIATDTVSRRLVRSVIEAFGYDPDEVDALIIDRFETTAVYKRHGKTADRKYIVAGDET